MEKIENDQQLRNVDAKIPDLAKCIIESYENRTNEDPVVFNAMIGGILRRMSICYENIQNYLTEKKMNQL